MTNASYGCSRSLGKLDFEAAEGKVVENAELAGEADGKIRAAFDALG